MLEMDKWRKKEDKNKRTRPREQARDEKKRIKSLKPTRKSW